MPYLMIANDGVCPIQGFTVLGVSSSRGTENIGQFGSGAKHAVNILLRNKIKFHIFLGEHELKFYKKDEMMGSTFYQRVCYKFKDEDCATGFALEFGELDWSSMEMALRELISNAIDQNEGKPCVINIVNEPKPMPEGTVVYIELNDQIRDYFSKINQYFLHFSGLQNKKFIENTERTPPRAYRRGVYIRTLGKMCESKWHYNFKDITIDECRNMNDSTVQLQILVATLNSEEQFKWVIQNFETDYFEVQGIDYIPSTTQYNKLQLAAWWTEVHGPTVICSNPKEYNWAVKKGHPVILVPNYIWYSLLRSCGIPNVSDLWGELDAIGAEYVTPSSAMLTSVRTVWSGFKDLGIIGMGALTPRVLMFTAPMSRVKGKYSRKDGIIYLSSDCEQDFKTIAELCIQHVTGAEPYSSTYEEFLVSALVKAAFR